MELSRKFGNSALLRYKQVVSFYYLDLEVPKQAIDLAFVEMVMKVVGLDFEVERVE